MLAALRRDGFGLVEVMVGSLLLLVAAAGLAGLIAQARHLNFESRIQTSATLLAAQKLEQLRALRFGFEEQADGSVGVPVEDRSTDLAVEPPAAGGPGVGTSPPDSLARSAPGYVDYLGRDGRWVGTGPAPVPGTVYVRRWSIRPLPSNPAGGLMFRVVVFPLARLQESGDGLPGRTAADLATIKVRKAR